MMHVSWNMSEAEEFRKRALEMGVPRESILIENMSGNTGENIAFTKRMLAERHINPRKIILVQKPYMERRSYATFEKLWPGKELVVTSPQISYDDYFTPELPEELVINIMVGDLQRIKLYPAFGFQIPQEIPPDVWDAYEALVTMGYTKHLIRES